MTKTSEKINYKVYRVINTFMDSFIAIEPRLKKSQLVLTATGDDLNLGSLDWMDVITELEGAFGITIETKGLFGANVRALLYACTRPLIAQQRLTFAEETTIIQEYNNVLTAITNLQQTQSANKAQKIKQNTK